MPVVDVYNLDGEKVSEISLSDEVFCANIREDLMSEVVRMQLANRRAGTASTKTRGEVAYSGRKPWRQKGTGRARAGSRGSPIWRGGGVIFGPKPRDYGYLLPKKVRRAALRSALSMKFRDGELVVLDNFELPEIKTKRFVSIAKNLDIENSLIVDEKNFNLERSSRNVPRVKVIRPGGVNVYDILRYKKLVLVKRSIKPLEERLLR